MLPRDYVLKASISLDKTLRYQYFLDKDHPLASHGGKVYMHRHVVSVELNRWLRSEELVHHLNEDRSDNRPENLQVTTSSKHAREHSLARGEHTKALKGVCACGKPKRYKSAQCVVCYQPAVFVNGVEAVERLRREVWEIPMSRLAIKYDRSDVALKKLCRKLGIETPSRGYWATLRT